MSHSNHVAILISILASLLGARGQEIASTTEVAVGNGNPFAFTKTAGADSTSTSFGSSRSEIVPLSSSNAASTAAAGDLATVSITAAPGYQVAQACVQECLYFDKDGIQGGLLLPELLGCFTTVYNGCYCTSAIAPKASSIISSCITELCTGTAQISDAISVYDAYCTSAGYPSNANAETTATTVTGNTPQTTLITNNIVFTFTVGSSTFLVTEPGAIQTITTAPSTTSSSSSSNINYSSSSSAPNVNVAGIVGGIVGALVLIGILLAILYIWLPRRQKAKAKKEAETEHQGQVGSTFVPKSGGGRAELQGTEKRVPLVGVEGGNVEEEKKMEMDGSGMGKYGLRPEELDSEGRFVGELHGDGREFVPGVELDGSEVRR